MKLDRQFIAERPLARHCPELLPLRRETVDHLPEFARWGARLTPFLQARMPVFGCDAALAVTVVAPREGEAGAVLNAPGAFAVHWLIAVVPGPAPVLISLDGALVLRMVDRLFGGRGQTTARLADSLTPAAELLAGRLGATVADCLAQATGNDASAAVLRHGTALADLEPFPLAVRLAVLDCDLTEPGHAPASLRIALPLTALADLASRAPTEQTTPRGPADPRGEPFGNLPLTLSAVLVDMAVPIAAIAALTSGAMLPVAVSRRVPLRIGEHIVAAGTVGTQDDRVALQLTVPTQPSENPR